MLAGGDFIKTSTGKVTPGRHAAGHADHAGGRPRLPGRDRPPGRGQAGRRHPDQQGRDQVPGDGERDRRRGLARPGLVPVRRLDPAQRPAHAADASWPPAATPAPTTSPWTDAMPAFEYAPAPESRSIVDIRSSYGLFINGSFVDPSRRRLPQDGQPGHRGGAGRGGRGRRGRCGRRGRGGPPRRTRRCGAGCAARTGPSTSTGIARIIQERARELAVLESIDNGKPIRESRDVDIPLVAAHFFYYAGWADKLEHAGFGPDPRPIGVAGQVIPWNFPLLMLAWKIAPALAARQHGRAQAGRDHPADRAGLRRDLPAGRPAARRGQHHHRRGRDRAAAGRAPGRGQGRVHRLHRGRSGDRQVGRRHPQAAHPRAGRQGGQHRLRRRPDRPGGRGDRQRHLLQPGPRLLRRLAPAGPGVGRRGRC